MEKKYNPHCKIKCVETGEIFNNLAEVAAAVNR